MESSGDSRTSKSVNRQVCILTFTSLAFVINLVVIIFAVYVMAGLRQPANSQARTAHSSHDHLGTIACIKCEQRAGDELLKSLTLKVSGVEELCCAESTSQMSALMELILRKPDQDGRQSEGSSDNILDSIKAGSFNFSRASAHKRLQPVEPFDSSKDPVPVFKDRLVPLRLNESHHEATLEHARGVNVSESGFQVTQPGTYHVYSSVRFKPDSSQPCSTFKFKVWEHRIMKGTPGTPDDMKQVILKSVHTCCDHCTTDRETSFVSGVFILKAGDQLSVEISGSGLITYFYQSSYFGLMMLGGPHGASS